MTILEITLFLILIMVTSLASIVGFYLFLQNRAFKRACLTAIIDIYPSGKSHIEFIPHSDIEENRLMKIALMYSAKARYVLEDEKPEILEAYKTILESIKTVADEPKDGEFIDNLSKFKAEIEKDKEFSSATKTGERFTVRLIEGEKNQYIFTTLPLRGFAINTPVSVILLIHAVAIQLSEINQMVFEITLHKLIELMFETKTPNLFPFG